MWIQNWKTQIKSLHNKPTERNNPQYNNNRGIWYSTFSSVGQIVHPDRKSTKKQQSLIAS
jgi:fatty-acid desaturase